MAESVKRRVAAARLAVAFVAAGTIAGATAWAQADPPPGTAQESILVSSLKLKLDSSNIKNGSLLFQDFIKGEVPSGKQFKKLESSVGHFKKATNADFSSIKGELGDIKNQLGSYIKGEAADARYIKLTDAVVRGDGSVFTATGQSAVGKPAVRIAEAPGMFTVDAAGPVITITNTSGGPLQHTSCGQSPAGAINPGQTLTCDATGGTAQAVQLIGAAGPGGGPHVATLNFSAITPQGGLSLNTVQILIGL